VNKQFDFSRNLILEADQIRLEPLAMDHLVELLPFSVNHPGLLRYSPSPFGGEEGIQGYIEQALVQKSKQLRYPFAIYDKHSKQFAGSTSFMNISNEHQRIEIGSTWLAPEFQRTGLNRVMKFVMLSYAFDTLGFERVEFKTDSRNSQSRTAIKALGALEEGILRNHMIMPDGYRRDTVYFSILRDEWPTLQTSVFGL
jgi:RimJ/RimL family protein N-acetyltransferase